MSATGQKHLLLEVPDYDHQQVGRAPLTRLQLGAYPDTTGVEKQWGEDLLDLVGVPKARAPYFKDDYRYANGFQHPSIRYHRDDGTGSDMWQSGGHDPSDLTGELRSRGGWRQHTDGNLISTTRGDRVEVIFGNHKMSVLGRMDVPNPPPGWAESFWETSGGHTCMSTNFPGNRVMVEWSPRSGASCWRVYDETLKGDSISRYKGIRDEVAELRTKESYIGSSTEGVVIPAADSPNLHQQTTQASGWVNPTPSDQLGFNAGLPRRQQNPDVDEETEAKQIRSTKTVTSAMGETGSDGFGLDSGKIQERVTITGTKTDQLFANAGHIVSQTTTASGGTITTQTGIAPELDASGNVVQGGDAGNRVQCRTSVSGVVGKVSSAIYGQKPTRGYGGWTFNFKLVGLSVSISANAVNVTLPNFNVANPNPFSAGAWGEPLASPLRHEFGVVIANTAEMTFCGGAAEINLGGHVIFKLVQALKGGMGHENEYGLFLFSYTASDQEAHLYKAESKVVGMSANGNRVEA